MVNLSPWRLILREFACAMFSARLRVQTLLGIIESAEQECPCYHGITQPQLMIRKSRRADPRFTGQK
jgi:hypothetical protein